MMAIFITARFFANTNNNLKGVQAWFGNGKAEAGVIGSIVLSWLLTLSCAAVCSAAIYFHVVGSHY